MAGHSKYRVSSIISSGREGWVEKPADFRSYISSSLSLPVSVVDAEYPPPPTQDIFLPSTSISLTFASHELTPFPRPLRSSVTRHHSPIPLILFEGFESATGEKRVLYINQTHLANSLCENFWPPNEKEITLLFLASKAKHPTVSFFRLFFRENAII